MPTMVGQHGNFWIGWFRHAGFDRPLGINEVVDHRSALVLTHGFFEHVKHAPTVDPAADMRSVRAEAKCARSNDSTEIVFAMFEA